MLSSFNNLSFLKILGLIALLLFSFSSLSKPIDPRPSEAFNKSQIFFSQLDTNTYLPHATVTAIEQDSMGYMWFGTQGGLVKFDGHRSVIYDFSKQKSSKGVINWITDLYTDEEGRVWAASGEGFSLYLPGEDNFQHFSISDFIPSSKSYMVIGITESPAGDIWFLTLKSGIIVLQKKNQQFTHIKKSQITTESVGDFSGIAISKAGSVYITTQLGNLLVKKKNQQHFNIINKSTFYHLILCRISWYGMPMPRLRHVKTRKNDLQRSNIAAG